MGKFRDRSFTGCWTCRSRKIKCDEVRPVCTQCTRSKLTCTGYTLQLTWVMDGNKLQRSDGRRQLRSESTWSGHCPLSSQMVEFLIAECDATEGASTAVLHSEAASGFKMPSPFRVFRLFTNSESPRVEQIASIDQDLSLAWPLREIPDRSSVDCFLFHHYINSVAPLMMPYEHPESPWKSIYPLIASRNTSQAEKVLFDAMITHAAFHLAHLRKSDCKIMSHASRSYVSAVRRLSLCIANAQEEFATVLASILTLMMAEIYSGEPSKWRHHLQGAWAFVSSNAQVCEKWMSNSFARASIQSLGILRTITDTAIVPDSALMTDAVIDEPNLSSIRPSTLITSMDEFGFTIGAPKDILQCISKINQLQERARRQYVDDTYEDIANVLHLLNTSRYNSNNSSKYTDNTLKISKPCPDSSTSNVANLIRHQANAFVSATYIHLYRTILGAPPSYVQKYVIQTFEHVSAFFTSSNNNFSIWPAFIAAVEAYTAEARNVAQIWLDHSTSFGMANRDTIRKVVEKVWQLRHAQASSRGVDPGSVPVDWREVMLWTHNDVVLV